MLVNVPAPERYAVHKLIVTALRRRDPDGAAKSRKDAVQAGLLLEAMESEQRLGDVGAAWVEAWQRGPKWRAGLAEGRPRLNPAQQHLLAQAVALGCAEGGFEPRDFGLGADDTPSPQRN